jgi:hypothetical protein
MSARTQHAPRPLASLIAGSLALLPMAVAVAALAAPAAAQFDLLNWTFNPSTGGGSGSLTPSQMMLIGPNSGCERPTAVSYTAIAPFAGTVVATGSYHTSDEQPEYDSFSYLIDGVATPISPASAFSWNGQIVFDVPAGATFGFAVGSVDCALGAGVATLTEFGFFPKAGKTTLDSVLSGEEFGSALAPAGDLNGDTVSDLLVGAPEASVAGGPAGRVVVVSGDLHVPLLVVEGTAAGDDFGFAVAGGDDLDGDGAPDLLIGAPKVDTLAPLATNAGRAEVRSGADGSLLQSFVGDAAFDQLGFAVAFVGDVDGDGVSDLAVGAPFHDAGASNAGLVRVHSGATGALLLTLHGGAAGDRFGSALSGAGDIDGDGVPDLIVGAPGADGPDTDCGRVTAHSGADGSVLLSFTHPGNGASFGTAVAAGDIDADGVPDVVGGAPFASSSAGIVYVHSGADGALLHTFGGTASADQFGSAVAVPGDVDRDGYDDVLIGSPQWVAGEPGSAQLRSGLTGAVLLAMNGEDADSHFGSAVSGLGDVDGDGDPELAVGAPLCDIGATDSGRVQSFAPVFLWTNEGNGLAGAFGTPVLSGIGLLSPSLPVKLKVQGAVPHTSAALVAGFSKVLVPFKGGVLVPAPDIVLPGLVVDTSGNLVLAFAWPPGLPSSFDVWLQMWVVDPSGPHGFSATNGLRATTP